MKGAWKWPLGDNLSPTVANLQGWANALIGIASLLLLVLLLVFPLHRVIGLAWLVVAAAFLVAGLIPYVRSVMISRGKSD